MEKITWIMVGKVINDPKFVDLKKLTPTAWKEKYNPNPAREIQINDHSNMVYIYNGLVMYLYFRRLWCGIEVVLA